MLFRIALVALLGVGCRVPSGMFAQTVGPVMPVGGGGASATGLALQTVVGIDDVGAHVQYRRAGGTQELALGFDAFHVEPLGDVLVGYVRLGANLIEWDRVGSEDGAGLLGPTFEIGISPGGVCVSLTAARDFRFNASDDTFVGFNVGICGVAPAHKYNPLRPYGAGSTNGS